MARMYAWIAIGVLAAAGCKGKAKRGDEAAPPGGASAAPAPVNVKVGDLFVYADVAITQAPPSPSFAAPLPTRLPDEDEGDENDTDGARPPEAYVRARMCAGDAEMRERVLTSLRALTKDRDGTSDYLDLSDDLGACDTPNEAWCAWLIEGTRGSEPPAVRDLFAVALAACDGPAAEAAANAKGISPAAVAKWREDTTFPPNGEVKQRPRATLDRCVADPDEPGVIGCLEELIQLDRPAAAKAAGTQVFDDIAWDEGKTVVTALRRYPAAGALAARLRAWKLLPGTAPAGGDNPGSVTAEELMDDGGASYAFLRAVEADDAPHAHAVALTEATARITELDGIMFEDRPAAAGKVELLAYRGGKRYRVEAPATELPPALLAGLLNAIARDQGATTRFMVARPGERGEGYLLIGPEAGLTAAVAEELLEPPPQR